MSSSNDFGEFLKKERIKNGYSTQKQLAEVSDISAATLSRIEAGIQQPSPETLSILSKYLKRTSYEELMIAAGYLLNKENDTDDQSTHDILRSYFINSTVKNMELFNRLKKESEIIFRKDTNDPSDFYDNQLDPKQRIYFAKRVLANENSQSPALTYLEYWSQNQNLYLIDNDMTEPKIVHHTMEKYTDLLVIYELSKIKAGISFFESLSKTIPDNLTVGDYLDLDMNLLEDIYRQSSSENYSDTTIFNFLGNNLEYLKGNIESAAHFLKIDYLKRKELYEHQNKKEYFLNDLTTHLNSNDVSFNNLLLDKNEKKLAYEILNVIVQNSK